MIVKTIDPESINGKIVSYPTGSQFFWLMEVDPDEVVDPEEVVEDTATFFAGKLPKPFEEGRHFKTGEEVQRGDGYYKITKDIIADEKSTEGFSQVDAQALRDEYQSQKTAK